MNPEYVTSKEVTRSNQTIEDEIGEKLKGKPFYCIKAQTIHGMDNSCLHPYIYSTKEKAEEVMKEMNKERNKYTKFQPDRDWYFVGWLELVE